MASKVILIICAVFFLIKVISTQCITNPDAVVQSLIQEAIGIPEGLTLGSTILGNTIPIGPNMAGNFPLPMNNLGVGANMGLPFGPNIVSGLPSGPNWPIGAGSGRLGLSGPLPPAAMAPPMGIAASNGGSFTVISSSPIAPSGLTVNSENAIEGSLTVSGQLPFLGSVSMDGNFPTAGGGMVSYGCGDGNIGMVNEGIPAGHIGQPFAPTLGFGPGMPTGQFNGIPSRGYNGLH